MKATEASGEFHQTLPSPNARRSVAEGIQISQTGASTSARS